MKDRIHEFHSPILMLVIDSSSKNSNKHNDWDRTRITIDHLIHQFNHLNLHLNDHLNHLNLHWIKLQDLSQRWQNSTKFCEYCRKLEANPNVRVEDDEVFCSSSVPDTDSQVEMAFLLASCHRIKCPGYQAQASVPPVSSLPRINNHLSSAKSQRRTLICSQSFQHCKLVSHPMSSYCCL